MQKIIPLLIFLQKNCNCEDEPLTILINYTLEDLMDILFLKDFAASLKHDRLSNYMAQS